MFTLFFSKNKIKKFKDVKDCRFNDFANYYRKLLSKGIYFSPSQYETNFISSAHTAKQLDGVINNIKVIIVASEPSLKQV